MSNNNPPFTFDSSENNLSVVVNFDMYIDTVHVAELSAYVPAGDSNGSSVGVPTIDDLHDGSAWDQHRTIAAPGGDTELLQLYMVCFDEKVYVSANSDGTDHKLLPMIVGSIPGMDPETSKIYTTEVDEDGIWIAGAIDDGSGDGRAA